MLRHANNMKHAWKLINLSDKAFSSQHKSLSQQQLSAYYFFVHSEMESMSTETHTDNYWCLVSMFALDKYAQNSQTPCSQVRARGGLSL